ncbi:MAG TPA: MFS transporter, partial [Methylomirabilota bacterium]|nr:MFS transporter [Methylomirabilota bacterium]
ALLGSGGRVLYTRALVGSLAITIAIHVAAYMLNAVLPFHATALGATGSQVGLLFSVTAGVAMFLRPVVGGWVDRHGARAVLAPGVAVLALTSLGFHTAATPGALIALMAGVGLANGLISTAAGVLAAQATAPVHRGEALGIYYLGTSLAVAVAAPAGIALLRWRGITWAFGLVTALAALILVFTLLLTPRSPAGVVGRASGFRLWSRHALGAAAVMVLITLGQSSIIGFVPLYAEAHGLGSWIGWFFGLYSAWMILCRAVLRGLSDHVGRVQVIAPAIVATTLGFLVLAWPPSGPSLLVAALLLGSGASLTYPTMIALLVDRAPEQERGLAMGTLSASWDVGVVIGSVLVGVVIEGISFHAGFAVGAAGACAGLLTFVLLERARARRPAYPRPAAAV